MLEIFESYFSSKKDQYIQRRYNTNNTIFYQNYYYSEIDYHYSINIIGYKYLNPTRMKRKEYEENFNNWIKLIGDNI
jgi:hypothetical protein